MALWLPNDTSLPYVRFAAKPCNLSNGTIGARGPWQSKIHFDQQLHLKSTFPPISGASSSGASGPSSSGHPAHPALEHPAHPALEHPAHPALEHPAHPAQAVQPRKAVLQHPAHLALALLNLDIRPIQLWSIRRIQLWSIRRIQLWPAESGHLAHPALGTPAHLSIRRIQLWSIRRIQLWPC